MTNKGWKMFGTFILLISIIGTVSAFSVKEDNIQEVVIMDKDLTISNGITSFSIGSIYQDRDLGRLYKESPLDSRFDSGQRRNSYASMGYNSRMYWHGAKDIFFITSNYNHEGENGISDKQYHLTFMEVLSSHYKTARKVGVGSSIAAVKKAYKEITPENGYVMMPKKLETPYEREQHPALIYQHIKPCKVPEPLDRIWHEMKLVFLYGKDQIVTRMLLVEDDKDTNAPEKNRGYLFEAAITREDMAVTNGARILRIGEPFETEQEGFHRAESAYHRGISKKHYCDESYLLNANSSVSISNFNHKGIDFDSDSKYYINNFRLLDNTYKTIRGVGVGNTVNEVKVAYKGIMPYIAEPLVPLSMKDFTSFRWKGVRYRALAYEIFEYCGDETQAFSNLEPPNRHSLSIIFAYNKQMEIVQVQITEEHLEKNYLIGSKPYTAGHVVYGDEEPVENVIYK